MLRVCVRLAQIYPCAAFIPGCYVVLLHLSVFDLISVVRIAGCDLCKTQYATAPVAAPDIIRIVMAPQLFSAMLTNTTACFSLLALKASKVKPHHYVLWRYCGSTASDTLQVFGSHAVLLSDHRHRRIFGLIAK